MIAELISRVFQARDVTHRAHPASKKYSEHMALGSFYEALPGKIDGIIEAYQGAFGIIDHFDVETEKVEDVAKYLEEEADWITTNREEIANDHASVINMIDDLVACYLSCIYKLENLK